MKGIVFSSFLEFTEQQLGEDFVDEMIEGSNLSTKGAYTNVGTYPVSELIEMIGFILERHDLDPVQLYKEFGRHTFKYLTNNYQYMVKDFSNSFDCIYHVDQTIHKNVLKLYPDAELPNMNAKILNDDRQLHLEYQSTRPFMHVAHGLLIGCIDYFGENISVEMKDLSNGEGTHAEFLLTHDD